MCTRWRDRAATDGGSPRGGPALVLGDRRTLSLDAAPGPLAGQPPLHRALGGPGRAPGWGIRAKGLGQEVAEPPQCQLAVLRLAALLRRHHPEVAVGIQAATEPGQDSGSLAGAERWRAGHVEDDLDPRAAGVHILTARPPAPGEA